MKQRQEKYDNKVYFKQHWNIKYTRKMAFPLNISFFSSISSVHVATLEIKILIKSRQKNVVKISLKWQMTCNLHVKQRNLRIKQCSTSVISSCMGS